MNNASLADQIEAGEVHACCLVEANLYQPQQAGVDMTFRRCRICHRRHFKMEADGMRLILRAESTRRTAQNRSLRALPGQLGARLRP